MKISNKLYDILKWIAMILIPALAGLYGGLSNVWGFPYTSEIVTTLSVLDAFMGILLGLSTAKYNKEVISNE